MDYKKLSLFVVSLSALPSLVMAQILGGINNTADKIGYDKETMTDKVTRYSSWAFSFLSLLFFLLMVYGGVLWMTASGDDKRVAEAKDVIKASIVGLIVVVSAFSITAFMGDSFTPGQ